MENRWLRVILFLIIYFLLFKFFSSFFNNFSKLERVIYEKELYFKARNYDFPKGSNQIIKILAVDFKSIQKLSTLPEFKNYSSRWPWNRRIFAKLLDFLTQVKPKIVGVDFFFNLDSSKSLDPEQDRVLAESIRRNGRVILAGFIDNNTQKFISPLPIFSREALGVGPVDMPIDPIDGSVSKCKMIWKTKDKWVYAWDYLIYNFYTGKELPLAELKRQRYINYVGHSAFKDLSMPGKYFEIVSVYDFISNFSYYKDAWKGKIILLGPTDKSLHDYSPVPLAGLGVGRKSKAMAGIEIHANILSNLLEDNFLYEGNKVIPIIVMAILFALTLLGGGFVSLLLSVFLVFLYYFFAFYQFFVHNLVYPYVSIVFVGIFSYFTVVFINYLIELREKDKIKNIFKQYVSKEVIEEILSHPEKLSLGGESKYLTVLFADVRGFTSFSEKHAPQEVVEVLNGILEHAMLPVEKYQGILDKFIGDCIMLVFGAPLEVENHEKNAVLCAFEMVAEIENFSRKAGIDLGMGIGINAAEVVIGNIGTSLYKDYTVIGDGVNTAARLEAAAKKGEVLVSEPVYQKVKDIVEVVYQTQLKVKGKEEPLSVYSIRKKEK